MKKPRKTTQCIVLPLLMECTTEKGIVLKPGRNYANIDLKLVVDAEFAGNKDTTKLIMGRVVYLNETLIG